MNYWSVSVAVLFMWRDLAGGLMYKSLVGDGVERIVSVYNPC